jgi:hypothetical protein
MPKLCPYCDRVSEDEKFCSFCARPIQEVKGTTKKEDKQWRESIKGA